MFGCIVEHVAALAQGSEITGRVAARIVIEMRAGKHYIGRTDRSHVERPPHHDPSATIRTPIPGIGIPPSPITKMRD